jgi:hypothetical protein
MTGAWSRWSFEAAGIRLAQVGRMSVIAIPAWRRSVRRGCGRDVPVQWPLPAASDDDPGHATVR